MKSYIVSFYRHHPRLSNEYANVTFQAQDLERALSRVKKDLKRLDALPTEDKDASKWMLQTLKEAGATA
jgi:hypothetical protein